MDYIIATHNMNKAYENPAFVKEYMSLTAYIDRLWWTAKEKWLNIIDIDNDDIINKSKGVFKRPVKKWNWGFGINKRVFHPYNDNYINPILYINTRSIGWKPKYDYICFEDNPQMWICLFKYFWFGYKLMSPLDEDIEETLEEKMEIAGEQGKGYFRQGLNCTECVLRTFMDMYDVNLPDEVSDKIWKRTDYTWPCTWFAPRCTGKGAFKTAYDVMNNWGANHGAISYGHIGADLITLCSMLRIPVSMHNVDEDKIFRPSAWNAFGMDKEGQDYRACAAYGPMYK